MLPRHALQAAAKQFGFDGTDKSLDEMLRAAAIYVMPPREDVSAAAIEPPAEWLAEKFREPAEAAR